MKYIVIDESGTLPDPQDEYVIVAAVVTDSASSLLSVINRERKRLRSKKSLIPSEIKFYSASEKSRKSVLNSIAEVDLDLHLLTVFKEGREIPDNPVNYGLLIWQLLVNVFAVYPQDQFRLILIDRHFNIEKQERELIRFLRNKFGDVPIEQVDSRERCEVSVADFVAGAGLYKYARKNEELLGLVEEKILTEKVVKWSLLKATLYANKKSA